MDHPFLLMTSSISVRAAGEIPAVPAGWIEMNSIEPVALTWVKAMPEKKLQDVPTLMVQVHPKTEKLEKLFKDRSTFEFQDKEWKQVWSIKSDEVFVLLSKHEDAEVMDKKKILQSWIETHD